MSEDDPKPHRGGPDGGVVFKDLRGPAIKNSVGAALGELPAEKAKE